jgi:hypothetical protein
LLILAGGSIGVLNRGIGLIDPEGRATGGAAFILFSCFTRYAISPPVRAQCTRPVSFGRTIVGPNLPSLTYMLTFDDLTSRERFWSNFGAAAVLADSVKPVLRDHAFADRI